MYVTPSAIAKRRGVRAGNSARTVVTIVVSATATKLCMIKAMTLVYKKKFEVVAFATTLSSNIRSDANQISTHFGKRL